MQFFFYIAFLVIIGVAIFAIQNSNAPLVTIRFLIWRFDISLIYTILGSIGVGILVTLLLWIPRAIQGSLRAKKENQGGLST